MDFSNSFDIYKKNKLFGKTEHATVAPNNTGVTLTSKVSGTYRIVYMTMEHNTMLGKKYTLKANWTASFILFDTSKHEVSQSKLAKMTLIDLIEMICDWKAATLRHNDGNIYKSIADNQKRFGYSDEIKQILINTVKLIEDIERDMI